MTEEILQQGNVLYNDLQSLKDIASLINYWSDDLPSVGIQQAVIPNNIRIIAVKDCEGLEFPEGKYIDTVGFIENDSIRQTVTTYLKYYYTNLLNEKQSEFDNLQCCNTEESEDDVSSEESGDVES